MSPGSQELMGYNFHELPECSSAFEDDDQYLRATSVTLLFKRFVTSAVMLNASSA